MALTAVATTTTTTFDRDSLRLTFSHSNESPPTVPAVTSISVDPPSIEVPVDRFELVCARLMKTGEAMLDDQSGTPTPAPTIPTGPQATIVLHYGQTTRKYTATEEVLCKLPFFAGALREGFRETVTKVVDMPDDDPELVTCLLQFLHTGDYTLPEAMESGAGAANDCKKERRMRRKLFHTSVFILADKYMCMGLCKLAALNIRKIVLSPMSFVNYMVSIYETTPPGSSLRIAYFVEYGCRDELLLVHPQWTISSHTRASITRLLEAQSTEERFVEALDRCPQLAVDLLSLISKGKYPVGRAILECPGAAKVILLHHCKQFYDKRPWTKSAEIVDIPWGWWKDCC